MKAQKLSVLCAVSSALLILVEAMAFGGAGAAYAQNAPQPMAGNASGNSSAFGDLRTGRGGRRKHRKHRRGHHRGRHQGRGRRRGAQDGAWQNQNPWGNSQGGMGAGQGQGRRHRRHRGGRRRQAMQINSGEQNIQPGGQFGR